jgi:parvulin-like peptidyl-prolyl isomerase
MPRLRVFVVAVLAVSLVAACAAARPPAAKVGDAEITDEQVRDTAELFRFLSSVAQQPCGEVTGAGDTEAAACNRVALLNLIEFQVSNAYAAQNDITASEEEIDAAVEQIEQQIGTDPFERQLAETGATREELRDLARNFSVLRQVATAVTQGELGPDEIRARYERDIARYTTIQVDHVLVRTEREAQEIYAQVTAPGATREDFLAIANERSIDPNAAPTSGSLGSAVASTYVPEFADAALALEPGEISQPLQTDFGWHVIRLEDAQVTPFAQARERILQDAAPEVFAGWLRRELADLEVNPRYGRFDPETLTIVRVDSTDPSASPSPTVSPSPTGPVNAPVSP